LHFNIGYGTVATGAREGDTQKIGIFLIIKETPGESISASDSTHRLNKTILCSGNDADGQIKIIMYSSLYGPHAKINFSVEFQDLPRIFLFISS
jgi:hypothetical protein